MDEISFWLMEHILRLKNDDLIQLTTLEGGVIQAPREVTTQDEVKVLTASKKSELHGGVESSTEVKRSDLFLQYNGKAISFRNVTSTGLAFVGLEDWIGVRMFTEEGKKYTSYLKQDMVLTIVEN